MLPAVLLPLHSWVKCDCPASAVRPVRPTSGLKLRLPWQVCLNTSKSSVTLWGAEQLWYHLFGVVKNLLSFLLKRLFYRVLFHLLQKEDDLLNNPFIIDTWIRHCGSGVSSVRRAKVAR